MRSLLRLGPSRRRTVPLAGVLTADQSVSSATNLLLLLAGATFLDGSEFGAFALGSSIFSVAMGITRTTSGERIALAERSERSLRMPIAPTSVLATTGIVSVLLLGLLLVTGRHSVLVWLLGAPVIILQDRLRYVAVAIRASVALVSDLAWLACVIGAWSFLLFNGDALVGLLIMTVLGPAVGFLVSAVPLSDVIEWRAPRDFRETLSEAFFVVDAWLLPMSVLAALAIVGLVGSLELTGQARLLLLFFQPFFSMAYAGRWLVLRGAATSHWPRWLTLACAIYGLATGTVLLLADHTWGLPALWAVEPIAFGLTAISQCARASHQALADLARRRQIGEIVFARVAFAGALVAGIGPLAAYWQLNGIAGSYLIAFTVGALFMYRRLAMTTDCSVRANE